MIEKALYIIAMVLCVIVFLFANQLVLLRIKILRKMQWDRLADLTERYSKVRVVAGRVVMAVLFAFLGWLLMNV